MNLFYKSFTQKELVDALKDGFNINTKNENGDTIFHNKNMGKKIAFDLLGTLLETERYFDTLLFALDNGLDINSLNNNNETIFHSYISIYAVNYNPLFLDMLERYNFDFENYFEKSNKKCLCTKEFLQTVFSSGLDIEPLKDKILYSDTTDYEMIKYLNEIGVNVDEPIKYYIAHLNKIMRIDRQKGLTLFLKMKNDGLFTKIDK